MAQRPPQHWPLERRERFLAVVATGTPIRRAARLARVSTSTVYAWLSRGASDPEGEHATFREAFERARTEAIAVLERFVVEAARKDWRAAERYLRVLDPERWGGRDLALERARRRKARAEADLAERDLEHARSFDDSGRRVERDRHDRGHWTEEGYIGPDEWAALMAERAELHAKLERAE